jgi:ABC-type multidrug transport system ATPase subunit/pSer/pThr/pTyr-binding forkhead associated (FHA) protein
MRPVPNQPDLATATALTLQVLPSGSSRVFNGSQRVVIGREPTRVDVVVAEPRASRQHASLHFEPGSGWVLEDLSSQGTFIQGTRVTRMVLPGPVVVRLGHPVDGQEVRLVPGAQSPATPPSAPRLIPQQDPGRSDVQQQSTAQHFAGPAPQPVQNTQNHQGPQNHQTPQYVQNPPQQQIPRLGEYTGAYQTAARVRIGRADDNDIVLHDPLTSRHHAEVRTHPSGRSEIVDLRSHNGTFVDGVRISRAQPLNEGSVVAIAHHLLHLRNGRLEEFVDTGSVTFSAYGLSVFAGSKVLLDEVSFALEGGEFLAVLGPTGAGKSTLLKALTGNRPADRGAVLYNGRDMYANYAELRNRVGYVPQDDILHPQLKVRDALRYAASLRFPPDIPAEDRDRRVEEVMAELGLSERAELPVEKLSGGQRKRTSVAIELLTRPSLLVLDEPTSGLDPGYEKSVMDLLRSLADGGRTVITVTHSTQSLHRCDRILFLAPGGQTAFFGPPAETLKFFNKPQYADVFQDLERAPAGFAKNAFAGSRPDQEYVRTPLSMQANKFEHSPPVAAKASASVNPHWAHQLSTLFKRFSSVVIADRRNTLMLFMQAPVLGLLMLAVLGSNDLSATDHAARGKAGSVLLALVLGATYLGASNSIREIVKEKPILTRERAIGLSPSAYLLSKALLLGLLTIAQSAVLVFLGIVRQGGPGKGSVFSSGQFELFVSVSVAGLAAMALGLLISAFVSNADKALTILPVVLFAEFLFTGSAFPVNSTPGLAQASYLASAKWGYSAAASTADLDTMLGTGCNDTLPRALPGAKCDATQKHSAATWIGDLTALGVLTLACLGGAWLAIRPIGQPKRK